jgi:addiction module RelE/StbE family toxin
MNKEFLVSWTSVAKDDLRLIVDYLSLDNPTKADEVIQLIRVQTQKLQELPARGRIVPELRFCGVLLYRELIVSPWRIIYRIDGENIWVLAVIDSRRNVEDILLERFIG